MTRCHAVCDEGCSKQPDHCFVMLV